MSYSAALAMSSASTRSNFIWKLNLPWVIRTRKVEIGDDHFGIIVDVFRDGEREEYMAVCLRYVDKTGKVMERFLGVVHIGEGETTVLSLKSALDSLLREHSLSLLTCVACLSPANRFSCFDKQKLIRLAEFYPDEFSSVEMLATEFQLDMYISDMQTDDRFSNLKDLNELSVKLVETGKHIVWWQVYLLLKLVLILPVEIANDERAFSMKFVRQQLERSITDQLLCDSLITLVEKDTFSRVPDDDVLKRFQAVQANCKQV